MRRPKNPFLLSGYHSPDYFCNREKELSWLIEQFDNERNAVIYANRRMGKTALIRHFFHYIEKKKQAKTLFIDLLGTISITEANKKLVAAIINQSGISPRGIGRKMLNFLSTIGATLSMDPISGAPQISVGVVQPSMISESLEAIGNYLKAEKKPIVIAIDEFQQVVNYHDANAEAIFRTWTQDFPMIRFVFSGSHRQMMQSMFSEQNRPFYKSAQLLPMDNLEQQTYQKFIKRFFDSSGLKINEEIIQSIFKWTRTQTYYVQLVCNMLFSKARNPDPSLLLDIQEEILQQEAPIFGTYQHLLTDYQWTLLKAIANAEKVNNPTSQEFIQTYKLGAASSVSTALNALIKKEFIIQYDDHYTLHDTLLLRWLQQL